MLTKNYSRVSWYYAWPGFVDTTIDNKTSILGWFFISVESIESIVSYNYGLASMWVVWETSLEIDILCIGYVVCVSACMSEWLCMLYVFVCNG